VEAGGSRAGIVPVLGKGQEAGLLILIVILILIPPQRIKIKITIKIKKLPPPAVPETPGHTVSLKPL
jgi:hypothetical protein